MLLMENGTDRATALDQGVSERMTRARDLAAVDTNPQEPQRLHLAVLQIFYLVRVECLQVATTELRDRLQRIADPAEDAERAWVVQRRA